MLSHLNILLGLVLCTHAASYDIYHRLQHPGSSEEPFVRRGTLELAGNTVSLESASTVAEDLALWTQKRSEYSSGALYQVALHADSDSTRAVSSVKQVSNATLDLVIIDALP